MVRIPDNSHGTVTPLVVGFPSDNFPEIVAQETQIKRAEKTHVGSDMIMKFLGQSLLGQVGETDFYCNTYGHVWVTLSFQA